MAGRYSVLETLHVGQESEVLLVSDLARPGHTLVLKRVSGRAPETARAVRLESEYRLVSSLRHPGLPRVRDFGYDLEDDATYLVSDLAPGKTLGSQAPLPVDTVASIAVDVCRALSLLHARSWLHLDVKPSNILHDPASGRTTLVDLDLAAFPEGAVGRGTPPYASLEAMGSGPVPDARTDLFSLGVTLYEILTGRPVPTDGATGRLELSDAFPTWLRDLVGDLIAGHPYRARGDQAAPSALGQK